MEMRFNHGKFSQYIKYCKLKKVEKTKLELGVFALFFLGLSIKYGGGWNGVVFTSMSVIMISAFMFYEG